MNADRTSETPRPSVKGERRAERALARFHDEVGIERAYDLKLTLRIWPLLTPHRRYLFASMAMLVAMSVLGLARPLVMREALSGFSEPGGAGRVVRYGFLLAGLIVTEQALAFPQMYFVQLAGARAMAELRRRVFGFLHGQSLSFFDKTPIGRLVTRVTNDVDSITEMFASGALNAIGDLIRLVAIVIIMVTLDAKMSLFAFVLVPPIALFVNWTRKRMRTAFRQVRVKTARMNAYLNEQVSGIGVVQAYAREQKSEAEFDAINSDYHTANVRAIWLDASVDATIEMVGSICIASILWYAGTRVGGLSLDFGTLFAFVAYIEMFFTPIRDLSTRYTLVQSALAGAERIFELLDSSERDVGLAESGAPPPSGWPTGEEVAFELDRVTFGYKPGQAVLTDVSLSAKVGETLALVGPTGSGKTTIASLLLRLYGTSDGAVRVFGRDVSTLDRATLRQHFAVVPQDVFLFPGTVLTNVAAGEDVPDAARVTTVLEELGVLDLFTRREGGIHATVSERGQNFSAGERQLIALARALYKDPRILVLDEPTASVDSDTERRLQAAMDAARKSRTSLVIAHRLSTSRGADRIAVMQLGRVVEQGTHEELLEVGGVYARLYELQGARRELEARLEQRLAAIG